MKHTSGPWIHERDGLILAKDGTTPALAIVYPNLSETNANAQLISAAPELLEACQIALEYMKQVIRIDPTKRAAQNQIKWLNKAIHKAKGE